MYEKDFFLDPHLSGRRVMLDCGQVGVAAEVWLKRNKVGERLWQPFALEVSKFLKPGENQVRIVVPNSSDAAVRAIPDVDRYLALEKLTGVFLGYAPPYLNSIDLNGLLGPIRLIPSLKIHLELNQ